MTLPELPRKADAGTSITSAVQFSDAKKSMPGARVSGPPGCAPIRRNTQIRSTKNGSSRCPAKARKTLPPLAVAMVPSAVPEIAGAASTSRLLATPLTRGFTGPRTENRWGPGTTGVNVAWMTRSSTLSPVLSTLNSYSTSAANATPVAPPIVNGFTVCARTTLPFSGLMNA
jgi:hypothetical protein